MNGDERAGPAPHVDRGLEVRERLREVALDLREARRFRRIVATVAASRAPSAAASDASYVARASACWPGALVRDGERPERDGLDRAARRRSAHAHRLERARLSRACGPRP